MAERLSLRFGMRHPSELVESDAPAEKCSNSPHALAAAMQSSSAVYSPKGKFRVPAESEADCAAFSWWQRYTWRPSVLEKERLLLLLLIKGVSSSLTGGIADPPPQLSVTIQAQILCRGEVKSVFHQTFFGSHKLIPMESMIQSRSLHDPLRRIVQ